MTPESSPVSRKVGSTAFTTCGAGEPVVLIHGVGMARGVWTPQVEALARQHTVITYDMLGHGESDTPAEGVLLRHYGEQLKDLLDVLALPSAHVVGHSMGALVALEFALNHPGRARRVVAMNAVFQRTPEQRAAVVARAHALREAGVHHNVEQTIERWFGHPVPEALKSRAAQVEGFLRGAQPLGYARTYALFATSDAVHADRLHTLDVPALFLTGELDANSSPAMSQAMSERAPHASWHAVAGARHMMNVTHPGEVNARLAAFLHG